MMCVAGIVKIKGTITSAPKDSIIVAITPHAGKRVIERGMTLEKAQQTIDNADFAIKQRKGSQYVYYTKDGFAVLDNNGVLGTLGPLDEGGKKLYYAVMKNVKKEK